MANTGYIYKICCNDVAITDVYVGSTKNHYRRKNCHKTFCNNPNGLHYNSYVYRYIRQNGGWDNWSFIILDTVQYNEKHELHRKEREYIESLNATLNKQVPTRTRQEYIEEHKEEIAEKNKAYHQANRERILEQQKQYYQSNHERELERAKQYRRANRERIKEHDKQRKQNNRKRIAEQRNQKITCECGVIINRSSMSPHQKTKRHHETFSRKIYDFIHS